MSWTTRRMRHFLDTFSVESECKSTNNFRTDKIFFQTFSYCHDNQTNIFSQTIPDAPANQPLPTKSHPFLTPIRIGTSCRISTPTSANQRPNRTSPLHGRTVSRTKKRSNGTVPKRYLRGVLFDCSYIVFI